MMNLNFLTSVGVLAPLVLFWQHAQSFILRIFHMAWKVRELQYHYSGTDFYIELHKNGKMFAFDNYRMDYRECRVQDRQLPIFFKCRTMELCLYKRCMPVLISGGAALKIQYLKFTFPFEKILKMVENKLHSQCIEISQSSSKKGSGFFVRTFHGKSLKSSGQFAKEVRNENYGAPGGPDPSNVGGPNISILAPEMIVRHKIPGWSLSFDVNELKEISETPIKSKYQMSKEGELVLRQVSAWFQSQNWYAERGINWRRGVALNGKPGNGKSSLVLEIAKRMEMPLFVFDLSSMDNEEYLRILNENEYVKAFYLFEDLDAVFSGRENITKTDQFGGLTFDCFINSLSGVDGMKAKFVFITTNHIEKLDPAILRPGRVDEIIHIQPLTIEQKESMARVFLEHEEDVQHVLTTGADYTTAEFENLCSQTALERFWDTPKA